MSIESDTAELFEMIEESFEDFMKDYEIDVEGSITDMLFEVFCAGFEAGADIEEEEEA
jgi:hypothetical protein